jgi:chromosome segregation ATPase
MADTSALPQTSGDDLPHVSLENSLSKSREIVQAVQQLQKLQEEADQKASKEQRSHAQTKEKIRIAESEASKAREIYDNELKEHATSKDKLDKVEREHNYTKESLLSQKQEVSSMVLQMEALKVEMEAQRKAFVVNVNWAAKCTELKVKYDESRVDFEKLNEQHMQTKSALETAEKVREEYKTKSQSTVEFLEAVRDEIAKITEELGTKTQMSDDIQAKLDEWEKFKQAEAAEAISSKGGRSNAMAFSRDN